MKTLITSLCTMTLLLLGGCTSPSERVDTPVPTATEAPPVAPAASGMRYTIVPEESWLRLRVYKTGPLARFGHNHVVASNALSGHIVRAPSLEDSAFTVLLPLSSLTVDEPAARRAEGSDFDKEIPANDRTATRRNMLGEKLLNAAAYPDLTLTSIAIEGSAGNATAEVDVGLAGSTTQQSFAFTLSEDSGRLIIEGSAELTHAQLNLEPFSALGGALRVRDDIGLRYYIVAERDKEML